MNEISCVCVCMCVCPALSVSLDPASREMIIRNMYLCVCVSAPLLLIRMMKGILHYFFFFKSLNLEMKQTKVRVCVCVCVYLCVSGS
jgi:hypothetical protein